MYAVAFDKCLIFVAYYKWLVEQIINILIMQNIWIIFQVSVYVNIKQTTLSLKPHVLNQFKRMNIKDNLCTA